MIPTSFAGDNQTVLAADESVQNTTLPNNPEEDILTGDIYFDANAEKDGDGSISNPYKVLSEDKIKDNSVIYLENGQYSLNSFITNKNLTVIGSSPSQTIIKNYGFENLDSSSYLTLKNLTFLSSNVANKGNLSIENSIFEHAPYNYRAVSSSVKTSLTSIINCTFSNNDNGGAINIAGGNLTISASLFENNYNSQGGAIYINNANAIIDNTRFISNYADDLGGSIYAENDARLVITNSRISGSYSASEAGGAIYIIDSSLYSNHLEITNSTSTFGGAILSLKSNLTLNNFTGKNNKAKYYGGAVYIMYNNFYLADSIFDSNSAENGGAVYVDEVYNFIPSNNKFIANGASNTGGAVYSVISAEYDPNSVFDIAFNNSFSDNHALFESDAYESNFPEMNIGDGNYILIKLNSSFDGILPSSYDLRVLNQVTPVKQQGTGGNCWAFASLAALESCILKATGKTYDLSEENMKNIMSMFSDYGWAMEPNQGGYDKMGTGYLTSWLGPVNESDDPYSPTSFLSPLLKSFIHVQNIVYLNRADYTENDEIKKAIMEYGGVATSIYWSDSYLGTDRKSYYCPDNNGANHAVTIVGWDDNYSKENFAKSNNKPLPPADGAWIIKNSWGLNRGEKGFHYVSYYDVRCAPLNKSESTYTFVLNDTLKFDKNYQYDISGKSDYFINSTDTVWYKNIFKASDNEYLAAVSSYFAKNSDWELSVYVNNVLKASKSGFSSSSYKTINLDELIPLKFGDIFEIVFKVSVDREASVPISESVSFNRELYTENISFISYDGEKWSDLHYLPWTYPDHTYLSQVACIKAFTILDNIDTYINLTLSNVNENTADIVARVFDEYDNIIKEGTVSFKVFDKTLNIKIANGVAKVTDVNLIKGDNTFSAKYTGTVGFNPSNNTISFENDCFSTTSDLTVSQSIYNPFEFNVTVKDIYGDYVTGGEVIFTVEGIDYTRDVKNGKASLNHIFNNSGNKTVSAVYNGYLDKYYSSNSSKTINVYLEKTNIECKFSISKVDVNTDLIIKITDSKGNPVEWGFVEIDIAGNSSTAEVVRGYANLTNLEFDYWGNYDVCVRYYDDVKYFYQSSVFKDKFYIEPIFSEIVCNDNVFYENNFKLTVLLKDEYNNPIGNALITVISGDYSVEAYSDDKGIALVNMNRAFGTYPVEIIYSGDNMRSNHNILKNITVKSAITLPSQSKYTYNSDYQVKLVDGNGNPLKNHEVLFTVKDKNYSLLTDANGVLNYNIKLSKSSYVISVTNLATGEVKSQKITVVNRLVAGGLTMFYGAGKYYKVRVYDDNGNIAKGVRVAINFNGKVYYRYTDSNGYASLKISAKAKTYTITATYKGFKVSNKIIIKPTLITKNMAVKKFKTFRFSVKLLNAKGIVLKNKKIVVKFKGKSYWTKTNKYGLAIFKIKVNSKIGRFSIITSYGSLKNSNVITVKK